MKLKLAVLLLIALFCTASWPSLSSAAEKTYKLSGGYLQSISVNGKKVTCGLLGNSWKVVKKAKKLYSEDKKASKAAKNGCKGLLKKGALSSLAQIPSVTQLASENLSSSARKALALSHAQTNAVSGTPPTILELARGGSIKDIFWSPGVIDAIASGEASQQQCGELFGGSSDGASSGFGGCYLTQSVGYSFQNALSGNKSRYMKSMGSESLVNSGGITVVDGTLPGNDITKVLSPADSSNRVVNVRVSGFVENQAGEGGGDQGGGSEKIFIKVASKSDNTRKGNQYSYTIWFCSEGQTSATEFERGTITLGGKFKAESFGGGGSDQHYSKIEAFLKSQNGEFVFDANRERTADIISIRSNESYKSQLEINDDNEIRSKELSVSSESFRSAYSISRFTGGSFGELRFLEGAYKDLNNFGGRNGSFSTSAEFRDSLYVSAPSNGYLASLAEVDLSDDSFYTNNPELPTFSEEFDCNAEADVTIEMDFTNPAMQEVASSCEGERIDGMDFCRSDSDVAQAMNQYAQSCSLN